MAVLQTYSNTLTSLCFWNRQKYTEKKSVTGNVERWHWSFSKNQSSERPWHSFNSVLAVFQWGKRGPGRWRGLPITHRWLRYTCSLRTPPRGLASLPRISPSFEKQLRKSRFWREKWSHWLWQKEKKWWFQFRVMLQTHCYIDTQIRFWLSSKSVVEPDNQGYWGIRIETQ